MNILFQIYLFCFFLYLCEGRDQVKVQKRIVNGTEADISIYSYQVSLQYKPELVHFCGGAIIAKLWILTVAHCFKQKDPHRVVIRVGSPSVRRDLQKKLGPEYYEIEEVIKHPLYRGTIKYDIAIIKIQKPLYIKPGARPVVMASRLPMDSTTVYVSGFGHTEYQGKEAGILLDAEMRAYSRNECRELFYVPQNAWCAAIKKGQSTCRGDSGGPAVITTKCGRALVGLVSQSRKCGLEGHPTIFQSIPYYRPWIQRQTGLLQRFLCHD